MPVTLRNTEVPRSGEFGVIELEADEANLVVVRLNEVESDSGIGPIRLGRFPNESGRPMLFSELDGNWQFRIGDDPGFATLPLPAKFAASTDVVFDLAAPSRDDDQ